MNATSPFCPSRFSEFSFSPFFLQNILRSFLPPLKIWEGFLFSWYLMTNIPEIRRVINSFSTTLNIDLAINLVKPRKLPCSPATSFIPTSFLSQNITKKFHWTDSAWFERIVWTTTDNIVCWGPHGLWRAFYAVVINNSGWKQMRIIF